MEYMNTVPGASATIHFLRFFGERGDRQTWKLRRPALEVGDTIVMDNCSTHHYAGGEALLE